MFPIVQFPDDFENRSSPPIRIVCGPVTLTLPGTEHIPLKAASRVRPDSDEFRKRSEAAIQYANHKTNPEHYTNRSTKIISDTKSTCNIIYSDILKSNISNNSNVTYKNSIYKKQTILSQFSKSKNNNTECYSYADQFPSPRNFVHPRKQNYKYDFHYHSNYKTNKQFITSPNNKGKESSYYRNIYKKAKDKNMLNDNLNNLNNIEHNNVHNDISSNVIYNNTYVNNNIQSFKNDNSYIKYNTSNVIDNNSYIQNEINNDYVKYKNIKILPYNSKKYKPKDNLFKSLPQKTIKKPLLKTPLPNSHYPVTFYNTKTYSLKNTKKYTQKNSKNYNKKYTKLKAQLTFKEHINFNNDMHENVNYAQFTKNNINYNNKNNNIPTHKNISSQNYNCTTSQQYNTYDISLNSSSQFKIPTKSKTNSIKMRINPKLNLQNNQVGKNNNNKF